MDIKIRSAILFVGSPRKKGLLSVLHTHLKTCSKYEVMRPR